MMTDSRSIKTRLGCALALAILLAACGDADKAAESSDAAVTADSAMTENGTMGAGENGMEEIGVEEVDGPATADAGASSAPLADPMAPEPESTPGN